MSSELESWYNKLRNLIIASGSRNAENLQSAACQLHAEESAFANKDEVAGELGLASKSGWMALHEACARNDMEVLDFLLKHAGTFVDVLTEDNETPLLLAVKHGNSAVVRRLIKAAHASLNIPNVDGLSPLIVAVQNDNAEMVQLLLKESDININHREHHGWSALHEASKHGRRHIVLALLKAGAQTNIQTNLGETPIYVACKHGHVDCVELLLRHDGRANVANCISGQTPLFIAANKNHVDCVSFLINYAADANISNKDGLLPLHTAVWANSVPCLSLLIPVTDRKKIEQYNGMTPVQLAVFRHNVEALQLLIEHNFDVNAVASSEEANSPTGSTAPYTFTNFGSVANLRHKTPLLLASLWNHETCIKLLLAAGADANIDDPLKYCISNNRLDMCDLLIKHGAILKPTHMFVAKSNEMLQLLLLAGLDPTPLFAGCQECHTESQHCPLIDDWLLKHFATAHATLRMILLLTGNVNKCNRFRQVMPKDLLPDCPRPLMHLCRVVIRQKFSSVQLLQCAKTLLPLPVPVTVKNYICCEELGSCC